MLECTELHSFSLHYTEQNTPCKFILRYSDLNKTILYKVDCNVLYYYKLNA